MPASALDAYVTAQRATDDGRQLEAALLFKAARQLEAVAATWEAPERTARLRTALDYNTALWSVFQASMEEPESPLPRAVRVNVLQLVRFIDRRTLEILASPAPGKLDALINIDRQIAMGLSTQEAPSGTAASMVGGAAA